MFFRTWYIKAQGIKTLCLKILHLFFCLKLKFILLTFYVSWFFLYFFLRPIWIWYGFYGRTLYKKTRKMNAWGPTQNPYQALFRTRSLVGLCTHPSWTIPGPMPSTWDGYFTRWDLIRIKASSPQSWSGGCGSLGRAYQKMEASKKNMREAPR